MIKTRCCVRIEKWHGDGIKGKGCGYFYALYPTAKYAFSCSGFAAWAVVVGGGILNRAT